MVGAHSLPGHASRNLILEAVDSVVSSLGLALVGSLYGQPCHFADIASMSSFPALTTHVAYIGKYVPKGLLRCNGHIVGISRAHVLYLQLDGDGFIEL